MKFTHETNLSINLHSTVQWFCVASIWRTFKVMLSECVILIFFLFFFRPSTPSVTVSAVCDNSGDSLWCGSLGTCSLPKLCMHDAAENYGKWQTALWSSSCWSMGNITSTVRSTVHVRHGRMPWRVFIACPEILKYLQTVTITLAWQDWHLSLKIPVSAA